MGMVWNRGLWARGVMAAVLAGMGVVMSGQATAPDMRPRDLPPMDKDPNRPAGLKQTPGRAGSWTDAEGRAYQRSGVGSWTNYDEGKANPFSIPDALTMKNGEVVKDAETWWKVRRPELMEDFAREVYGRIPENTPKVTWEVTEIVTGAAGGLAMKKTVVGHIDHSRYPKATPSIHLTLYLPVNANGAVPLMVQVVAGPGGYGAPRAGVPMVEPEPTRGSATYQLLGMGWGYASFEVGPVQNDYAGGLTSGIIGLMNGGKERKPDEWGALAAWSWGLSRAMDYLETDKGVDAKHVGVEGHSRYGKAALLAAALDQRWAIVFASCSGEGGAKLSRRNFGETVDNIAGSHWMAGNFRKYAGHWEDLPVDANELIALVAPRPVFITGGTGDPWSDPHGEFLAAVGAGEVYRLLGAKDLGSTEMPGADEALVGGEVALRYHKGPHTDTLDWPTFLGYAKKYMGGGEGGEVK